MRVVPRKACLPSLCRRRAFDLQGELFMKNIPIYNPEAIETKWQRHWEETHAFAAERSHEKPKFYPLIEFPYPFFSSVSRFPHSTPMSLRNARAAFASDERSNASLNAAVTGTISQSANGLSFP